MIALLPLLTSRGGLLAMAAAGVFIFYEGIPAGPLNLIPGVHYITDGRVDRERRAAREGYVQAARLIAAQAELAETRRQLEAGRKAAASYAELLTDAQGREAALQSENQKKDADYEAQLAAEGRRCLLAPDDLRFFLR